MYKHVVQTFLFLTENTRQKIAKKTTQILPHRFNQQDLQKSVKYSEMIYELQKWCMSNSKCISCIKISVISVYWWQAEKKSERTDNRINKNIGEVITDIA